MKWNKWWDLIFNIIIPVFLGFAFYYYKNTIHFNSFIKNHFADGLWAYAFYSSLLIIWNRQIKWIWLLLALLSSFTFEYFQFIHIIPGTGDWIDVYTYLIFFIVVLLLNNFFKHQFKY
jgi:hypothetical protein